MKTSFTPEQLQDPFIAEAETIIKKCIGCGLCTASCPSYVVLGDERASPRGRISLIHQMLQANEKPNAETLHFLDNCLTCLGCMTACPSRVDYRHLIDMARSYANTHVKRPPAARLHHLVLAGSLPHPNRLKSLMSLGRVAKPLAPKLKQTGLKSLSAMLDAIPERSSGKARHAQRNPAEGRRLRRVALIPGCANDLLRPQINNATIKLLTRMGVEVIAPSGIGCCGAIDHNLGELEKAMRAAKRNVDLLSKLHAEDELDAIITTASGCGTSVKDYARLLRDEPGHAVRAEDISGLARDLTEVLPFVINEAPRQWGDIHVVYHAACALEHGQQVHDQPRALLRQAGFIVAEAPEAHLCCGASGTYSLLQPEIATALKARKLDNLASTRPDIIATTDVNCINHMASESPAPMVHIAELLNWAHGGDCPNELHHLQDRIKVIDGDLRDSLLENIRWPQKT